MKKPNTNTQTQTPVYIAPKIYKPIHLQTWAERAQTIDRAVTKALESRNEKAPCPMFDGLLSYTTYRNDREARSGDALRYADIANDKRTKRAELNGKIKSYKSQSQSKRATQATRDEAEKKLNEARAERDKLTGEIKDLESVTPISSMREDLFQIGMLASLDPIVEADPENAFAFIVHTIGQAINELASPTDLSSTTTAIKPISEAEANAEREAHPDIVTIVIDIDPNGNKIKREVKSPAKIPFNVRSSFTAGYYTIEERKATKTRPAGWYRVNHYHRPAPCVSFESLTTNDNDSDSDNSTHVLDHIKTENPLDIIAKNDGISAILNAGDLDSVKALFNRARLNNRDRITCLKLTDSTARHNAENALDNVYKEVWAKFKAEAPTNAKGEKIIDKKHLSTRLTEAREKALNAYEAELWSNAFARNGINAKSTRNESKTRIRHALAWAVNPRIAKLIEDTEQELSDTANEQEREKLKKRIKRLWGQLASYPITDEERAEHEQTQTARSMTRKPYGGRSYEAPRADLTAWATPKAVYDKDENGKPRTRYTATPYNIKPVCRFNELTEAPQTLTKAEAEAIARAREAERTAHHNAHRAEITRVSFRQTEIANKSHKAPAFHALDAQWMALRIWDRMTPAEQDKTIEQAEAEARAREEARAEAERRSQFPAEVYTLNTTFEVWQTWNKEARAEHIRFLNSL